MERGSEALRETVELLGLGDGTGSRGPRAARLGPYRGRHPALIPEAEKLGPEDTVPRILLSRRGPEPLDTLRERTVLFGLLFRELLDEWAQREHRTSFGEAIEPHIPGAARLWLAGSPSGTPD